MKLDLGQLYMGVQTLTVYRNASKDECFASFTEFLGSVAKNCDIYEKTDTYSKFVTSLYEKGGDFGLYISELLECDDNFYAKNYASEKGITAFMTESFKNELKDSTKIIIAQRISSVIDADEIFVMDDGKITGKGTHHELLAANTEYQEIYASQMEGKTEGGAD